MIEKDLPCEQRGALFDYIPETALTQVFPLDTHGQDATIEPQEPLLFLVGILSCFSLVPLNDQLQVMLEEVEELFYLGRLTLLNLLG